MCVLVDGDKVVVKGVGGGGVRYVYLSASGVVGNKGHVSLRVERNREN